jgi:hypothetical protein
MLFPRHGILRTTAYDYKDGQTIATPWRESTTAATTNLMMTFSLFPPLSPSFPLSWMLSFRNYISVVQSMGRAKEDGKTTKDTGQDELFHIAFMVFITFRSVLYWLSFFFGWSNGAMGCGTQY